MKKSCHRSLSVSFMSVVLGLTLSGCASMRPPVPSDVAQLSTPLALRSTTILSFNNGSFEAGEYNVTGINYGAVHSGTVRLGPFTQGRSSGSFRFVMAGPREAWTAECGRGARSKGMIISRAEVDFEKSTLHCELRGGSKSATLDLIGFENSRHGSILMGETYSVRQYFADAELGQSYIAGPLGMRIDRNGENVGALEFAQPGAFWINRRLAPEQQDAVAGMLAAMFIEYRRNGV